MHFLLQKYFNCSVTVGMLANKVKLNHVKIDLFSTTDFKGFYIASHYSGKGLSNI